MRYLRSGHHYWGFVLTLPPHWLNPVTMGRSQLMRQAGRLCSLPVGELGLGGGLIRLRRTAVPGGEMRQARRLCSLPVGELGEFKLKWRG